jgi:hypothetical protein
MLGLLVYSEDGSSRIDSNETCSLLQMDSTNLPGYTALHPRWQPSSQSPLWKSRISHGHKCCTRFSKCPVPTVNRFWIDAKHLLQCLASFCCCTVLLAKSIFPWNQLVFQGPAVAQPLSKLRTLNGTWRFITVVIRTCHLSLSWARRIQSIPRHPISVKIILLAENKVRSCWGS